MASRRYKCVTFQYSMQMVGRANKISDSCSYIMLTCNRNRLLLLSFCGLFICRQPLIKTAHLVFQELYCLGLLLKVNLFLCLTKYHALKTYSLVN